MSELKPKYTVAMINLNMAETLEESLKSILDQLDENFEVLVVDDGSTDRSQEILDNLEKEYDIFRWIKGENENRGAARKQSIEESEGENIIVKPDCDDRYKSDLKTVVKFYEELSTNINKDVYLYADGLDISSKDVFLKHNYRSLHRAEDYDLIRRIINDQKIELVPLDNQRPYEEIGSSDGKYQSKSKIEILKLRYSATKNNFKSGCLFWEFLLYQIRQYKRSGIFDHLFNLIVSPLAYIHAKHQKNHILRPVANLCRVGDYKTRGMTGREISNIYNIETSKFSEKEKSILNV